MPNGEQGPAPEDRLPERRSVLVEMTFVPRRGAAIGPVAAAAAVAGPRFRILRTLEVDEYEAPLPVSAIMALAAPLAAPTDNNFRGTARKAAKLSIASATTESFDDVKDLIATFPAHDDMAANPDIDTGADNNRVDEEKRNVRVKAFLYAASRESDNDFHLIIGRDPSKSATYMTAEVSGLPPNGSASFQTLNEARNAYFEFFSDGLPGTSYDFYDPPIPVEITGSLFWDASHATGGRPGPSKLRPKMPVVWEIHPVTRIVFEP
jgi:hypothetical protein